MTATSRALLTVLVLVAHVVAGCVYISRPAYPSSWAPLQRERTGCDVLAGRYENAGVGSEKSLPAVTLWHRLFGVARTADHVEIAERADGLWATLLRGDLALDSRPLGSAGAAFNDTPEVSCRDGTLTFRARASTVEPRAATTGGGTYGFELAKAIDGALILKRFEGGGGVAVVVLPVVLRWHEWYRFAPNPRR